MLNRKYEVQPTSFADKTFLANNVILETLEELWNSQFEYFNLSVWRVSYKDTDAMNSLTPRYRLDSDYFWKLNSVLGYVSQIPFQSDLRFSRYLRQVRDLINYEISMEDNIFDYLDNDRKLNVDSWYNRRQNGELLTDEQIEKSIYNRCQRFLVDLVNRLNQWKEFKGSEKLMEFVVGSFNFYRQKNTQADTDRSMLVTLRHWFTTDYDIFQHIALDPENMDTEFTTEWQSLRRFPHIKGNKSPNKGWDSSFVELQNIEEEKRKIRENQMTPTPHSTVSVVSYRERWTDPNDPDIINRRWDYDNWETRDTNEIQRLCQPIFDIILPMWHTVTYESINGEPFKSKGCDVISALPFVDNRDTRDLINSGILRYNNRDILVESTVNIYNSEVKYGNQKLIQNPQFTLNWNVFNTNVDSVTGQKLPISKVFNSVLGFNSFSTITMNAEMM